MARVKKGNGINESDSKKEILIRVEGKITELNDRRKYRLIQIFYQMQDLLKNIQFNEVVMASGWESEGPGL